MVKLLLLKSFWENYGSFTRKSSAGAWQPAREFIIAAHTLRSFYPAAGEAVELVSRAFR